MKILVAISKAPDTTSKISFTDGDTKFNEAGVQFIINPYEEWYALVRGLELKEAQGGSVTTITIGDASSDPIIRKALAIGADDAVRIDAQPTDAYFVATQIAEYAKDKGYDLIMVGKETIDYNGSQVGGLVAGMMDLPYMPNTSKLEVAGTTATAERDVQAGEEVLEAQLPLVLSASKGMSEQRIPNMRGIMAARSKKLEVLPAVDASALTEIISYTLPPAKSAVKLIDPENAGDLIQLLHTEAKVI
ncbi:MAG: electron transfer flavoprotein beta subunit [Salibacteraceae bacterium]|jgi:electron transfer flavoprotein beta subunit